jgi:tRNA (cytidine/uridine-2'-O-)-methyltransferase
VDAVSLTAASMRPGQALVAAMSPSQSPVDLPPHRLSVALVHPQIAPNAGNVGRLCVATGTALHLVRPLGFVLSDRQLQRAGMDYWPRLDLTVHDDLPAFLGAVTDRRIWLFTTKAGQSLWDCDLADGDCLVFGSEAHGLPAGLVASQPERAVRIPQRAGERCLNLSTAVGVGLFEGLRRQATGMRAAKFRASEVP